MRLKDKIANLTRKEFDLVDVYTTEVTENPKRNMPMPVRIYLHRKSIREGFEDYEEAKSLGNVVEFKEGDLYFVNKFKKIPLTARQVTYVNKELNKEIEKETDNGMEK